MSEPLNGRRALVTGGGKRLGKAIALELARRGVNVVVHYLQSGEGAEAVCDECKRHGVEAHIIGADLGDAADAEGLISRAEAAAGPIDILVNSASIFPGDTLRTMTTQSLCENVSVNALAPLILGRTLAANGRLGDIVNLLDARIEDYDSNHAAYHLSKRMLASLTRMMAVEFAPEFRVNAVAPGLILPPEGKDQAYLEALADSNPLRAVGSPEDVTDAVVYLLSSVYVTGQTIFVDGGRHMKGRMYG